MERITKQDLISGVAEKWKEQYYGQDWDKLKVHKSEYTHKEAYLLLLQAKTEEEIENIIGNDTWTRNKCHECNRDSNTVIILGEPIDYESNTAQICPDCLKKALELVND